MGHFLLHVLDDPQGFRKYIQKSVKAFASSRCMERLANPRLTVSTTRQAGSVIVQIVYGYNAEQFKKDPLLAMMAKVMDDFAKSATPGAYLVDIFPACASTLRPPLPV